MKQTFTRIAAIALLTSLYLTSNAQYNIPGSMSTSAMGANGFSTCNNCVFNISPGATLTINTGGTCTDCTFNGGSVNIASSSSVTWNGTTTFNNDTLLINKTTSFNNFTFTNDSVAVNATLSNVNNAATISGSRLGVAANMNFNSANFSNGSRSTFSSSWKMNVSNNLSIDASSFYLHSTSSIVTATIAIQNGSTIVLDGTSTSNLLQSNNALPISNSTIIMSGSAKLTAATITMSNGSTFTTSGANTITSSNNFDPTNSTVTLGGSTTVTTAYSTFKNSTFTMSGTASLTSSNTLDLKTTIATLNGNAAITTNNYTTIENNSSMVIGDGTLASTAHLYSNNTLQVLDNSQMRISNQNNYLNSNSSSFQGGTSSYTINPNTISCNYGAVTGYAHSCTAKFVYGCATINKSGAVACTSLAVADISLTAKANANAGTVTLSWTDISSSTVTGYQVQRSDDSKTWTTLNTVIAGGYTTGDYTFNDDNAPAGTIYYRIMRTDKDGSFSYSAISSVTITATLAAVKLYPNPTTGHTFFIATATTEQLVVSIYTMTGQLLTQTQLKGQTQYALQVPAQVQAGAALVVRTVSRNSSQAVTLLVR